MQVLGLQVRSRKSKKFTTYRGTIGVIAPNHLERDFSATAPKQKWVTDITEFKAKDGSKVYLSPILDLFNNEIVSYNLSYSPNWAQVEGMLMQAVKGLNKACGITLHSDQGDNIKWWLIVESWLNTASFKVCREKGIAWTTQQWKVSLGD